MPYYSVVFEIYNDRKSNKYDQEYRTDLTEQEILNKYVTPYETGQDILINGSSFSIESIKRLRVFESDQVSEILEQQQRHKSEMMEEEARASGGIFCKCG